MRRRTVLTGVTALISVALAGCTGGAGPGAPGDGSTDTDGAETPAGTVDTDTSTATGDRFTARFSRRERCPNPGEATVDFGGDGPVSVVGCVVGKNGCTVPRLRDAAYDAGADEITVVVAAVEERDEDEACTEALVNLGYEVELSIDGDPPTSVRVVHDDVDGRRTVVDVTR
ncbi:hypothetical protein [Halobellus sp. GM3]|uniref:hypothetical protein n=1 Tax=Halobellus sp. GM3 TaxID=3458410 RepID=UPI00403D6F49